MMNISGKTALIFLLATGPLPGCAVPGQDATDRTSFQQADDRPWREVFADDGTGEWKQKWFLDGEVGKVGNGPDGMTLTAGPEFGNDAHHMVLWTRDSFEGDLKIEYDFTRLDAERRCVTILYIQANRLLCPAPMIFRNIRS
jgi:hypothetical protein